MGVFFTHISKTFQHRMAEWLLAAICVTWGWILIRPEHTFDMSASYMGLVAIAPERTWGVFCLLVGTIRLVALIINGHLTPPTYWVRSLTSGFTMLFWFTIVYGMALNTEASTGLAVYPWLMVAEGFCLFRTATDYRVSIIQRGI